MSEILVVLSRPVPGREAEFNRWYTERHLADVLGLDGFVAARRYEFVPSRLSGSVDHPYMAIYEVEEGGRERAEKALLAALRENRDGPSEPGGTPRAPLTEALDPDLVTWWFAAITDRVES
jgi:hypothetical protein